MPLHLDAVVEFRDISTSSKTFGSCTLFYPSISHGYFPIIWRKVDFPPRSSLTSAYTANNKFRGRILHFIWVSYLTWNIVSTQMKHSSSKAKEVRIVIVSLSMIYVAQSYTSFNLYIDRCTGAMACILSALALCGAIAIVVGVSVTASSSISNSSTVQVMSILNAIQQAPALRVVVQVKRPSMALNGQTKSTIYLVPRTASSSTSAANTPVKFDALLVQPGPVITETYMLFNDRAYWSKSSNKGNVVLQSECLDASRIPPISLVRIYAKQ